MREFKDTKGRTWKIEIHVPSIKRVRELLNTDLLKVIEDEALIDRVFADPVFLIDLLVVLVRCEPENPTVTDEDFGRSFSGEVIQAGADALLQALLDFSQSPKARPILREILDRTRAVIDKRLDLIQTRVSSGEIEKNIEATLDAAAERRRRKPGSLSGSAAESAESNPVAGASGN